MERLKAFLQKLALTRLFMVALLLCIPAFLIHLPLIGFIGDEAIRTLVAFEMHKSGEFIVPTLSGDLYFNKPPLYNWLIYVVSQVFGFFGEWPTRMTTLLCLAGYAVVIFVFIKKHTDRLTAVTMVLMMLTIGRILFWDSMLGLIDICFSAVIFLNFMVLYQFGKTDRWRKLFILSYLLFSTAFMLKGLPALVFQGISVLTAIWFFKKLKSKLVSVDHLLGALMGILPVVIYYILYARQVSLAEAFAVLTDQSLQRTATHHGIGKTILHAFTFPFEQVYHFLPWSLLIILVFHPKCKTWIRENEFVRFNACMLLANIPVYWLSVQVYPRYLLMFVPLFNLIGYYVLQQSKKESVNWWKTLEYAFLILAGIASVAVVFLPIFPQVREIHGLTWIWIGCSIGMLMSFAGLWADARRMMIWMSMALLMVRIVFDLVVIPLRAKEAQENVTREDAKRLAAVHGDHPWYLYGESFPHEVARYYSSVFSDQIIPKTDSITDPQAYYLVDVVLYPVFPGQTIDSLILERGQLLHLKRPLQ